MKNIQKVFVERGTLYTFSLFLELSTKLSSMKGSEKENLNGCSVCNLNERKKQKKRHKANRYIKLNDKNNERTRQAPTS